MNAPDRIVTDLVAAHDAREVFPTGHLISMTREIDDKSRALSVATCECGAVIRLLATKHKEMDAAVEAHWQRFDHVDDRGQPHQPNENVGGSAIPPAGVPPMSEPAAADTPMPSAAAGSLHEAPPIGGGDDDEDDEWMLTAAAGMAWREEAT